jgi:hypothetical protein
VSQAVLFAPRVGLIVLLAVFVDPMATFVGIAHRRHLPLAEIIVAVLKAVPVPLTRRVPGLTLGMRLRPALGGTSTRHFRDLLLRAEPGNRRAGHRTDRRGCPGQIGV